MITITLTDDSTVNYSQYRVSGDKAEFIGPASTDLHTDSIYVRSTAPKRGNGQYGNRRSNIDVVRGTNVVDLEGQSVVRDRKLGVVASYPVGTTAAEIIEDAKNLASLLEDSTFVENVFLKGIIEY